MESEKLIIDEIGKRIDDMKDYLGTGVNGLRKDVREVKVELDGIKTTNAIHATEIKNITNRVDRLEHRVDKLSARSRLTISIKNMFGSTNGKIATIIAIASAVIAFLAKERFI